MLLKGVSLSSEEVVHDWLALQAAVLGPRLRIVASWA